MKSTRLLVLLLALLLASSVSGPAALGAPQTNWVQATEPTELWSGPTDGAISFGPVAQWDYFQVVQASGPRLYVFNPRTKNYAWIDADKVGPSGPPPKDYLNPPKPKPKPAPAPAPAPPPAPVFKPWWVETFQPTPLWSSDKPDAITHGQVDAWSFFQVTAPQTGARLQVRDPLTNATAFIDASAVGPAGEPKPADLLPRTWRGYVGADSAYVRSAPNTQADIVGELHRGDPVAVSQWVEGEQVFPDQPGWAKLDEGAYVYGPLLRRFSMTLPPPLPQGGPPFDGHWIDVNLSLQEVTAYEGQTPIYWAPTSSGRPGWETPVGVFTILRRVESETMDSNTLLGKDAERASYKVEHVRWTQYITNGGVALHENYWRDPALFGIPSSHGCLGLLPDDAKWFWTWADVGTPVVVHP